MISLCVPSRGRPERFKQMVRSATSTAQGEIEFCVWRDEDDATVYPKGPHIVYGTGERPYLKGSLCTSGLWSKAWGLASGEIAMLAADDIIFRTQGWDTRVTQAFEAVPDRIVMVYGDDGSRVRKAPVNPFLHRRWIDAAGFTPSDFQGWFADEWIWQMAAELGRVVFLDDVLIQHLQRGGTDQTYRDGAAARKAAGGQDGMRERFFTPVMVERRKVRMRALRRLMTDDRVLLPDPAPVWLTQSLERVSV